MGRNGAGDPTSSSNIGEEYQTSERMVNVMFVYVLNCHGEPLMPCQPRKARLLLHKGKAKVVRMVPFTIQLLYGSSSYFDLRSLDGTKVSTSYKRLHVVQKASALLVERRAAFPGVQASAV